MNSIKLEVSSAEETMRLGGAVAQTCASGDIIALEGELGAGKTQFTRGLARGLGLDEREVSSPTFVTVQEYWPKQDVATDGKRNLVLVHIDAWRMKGDGHELEAIGWGADGAQLRQDALVAIEWPSKMGSALGPSFLQVHLRHAPDDKRQISMVGVGVFEAKMQAIAKAVQDAGFILLSSN